MKKNFNVDELRKELMDVINEDMSSLESEQKVTDWMDETVDRFMEVAAEAVLKFPEKKGYAEALMLSIGRYVCTYIERQQQAGIVAEGVDLYEVFSQAILPLSHEIVKKEAEMFKDEDEIMSSILEDLKAGVPSEEIVDKYFDFTPEEREAKLKEFIKLREEYDRM